MISLLYLYNLKTKHMSQSITNAFKDLRRLGYFARQNFLCCQSCGWAAVPEDKEDKVVFFHNQDYQDKVEGRPFYLAWNGDGKQICSVLRMHGVEVEWSGDSNQRIRVVSW
jgi:hypothetical protein